MFLNTSQQVKKVSTAVAFKKSLFEKEKNFLFAIKMADRYHNFVFLDYEGKNFLLSPQKLEQLLQRARGNIVFTLATRAVELRSTSLLSQYLELAQSYENLFFTVVAGHPAYDSVDTRISFRDSIAYLLERIREHTKAPIFIGSENVSLHFIMKLDHLFSRLIPFLLNGDDRLLQFGSKFSSLALYSPVIFDVTKDQAVKLYYSYLLRRKYSQMLLKTLSGTCSQMNVHELLHSHRSLMHHLLDKFVLTEDRILEIQSQLLGNNVSMLVGFFRKNAKERHFKTFKTLLDANG